MMKNMLYRPHLVWEKGKKNIQNTHRLRGFKVTFADGLTFSLIAELTYEIDV
jgi:hypothetical protein